MPKGVTRPAPDALICAEKRPPRRSPPLLRYATQLRSTTRSKPSGCAQAVEHYEIARYGTLKAWAEQLKLEDAAKLLDETLEEEQTRRHDLPPRKLGRSELDFSSFATESKQAGRGSHEGIEVQRKPGCIRVVRLPTCIAPLIGDDAVT